MKIYGALASPFVARAILFARLKGVDLELVPARPGSADYKAINPIGKIPALETDDGQWIAESEVICEYIEDLSPEPSGLPATPIARAQSRMVSRVVDLYLSPAAAKYARQINPEKRDAAIVAEATIELEKSFAYLAHFMGDEPFAAGDKPTLGDCTLAFYMQMVKILVFANFPEIADPTETNPRLKTWWDAIQSHEVCKPLVDEYAVAFDQMMQYFRNA